MEVLGNKLGVLANMYFPTNEGYLREQTQILLPSWLPSKW
jgi:hypothetical protein